MTTSTRLLSTLAALLMSTGCSDTVTISAPGPTGDPTGYDGGAGGDAGSGDPASGDPALGDSTPGDSAPGDPGTLTSSCNAPPAATLQNASVPAGFCAYVFASGLSTPRGITRVQNGDVLVVERDGIGVTALWDDDGDGVSGASERAAIADAPGLNHGITVHGGYLYASSATTVFRWAYAPGDRADLGAAATVVSAIPSGGHRTRTLIVDGSDRLYASVGSAGNVDNDSSRARIRRFDLTALPSGGFDFSSGEVFADGLRNEVGLAFDSRGRLWGVENGVDNLNRTDLGGDIHDDNPGEEVNLFATPGAFYGYPYCWSEYNLPAGQGTGTQWAHPQFIADGTHDDAWCQNVANVVPPALSMQAHVAPLGIRFYDGAAFPPAYRDDAFVAQHGSWNRSPAVGYKVMRLLFDSAGNPTGSEELLAYDGAGDTGAGWPYRFVDLAVAQNGALLVTSDSNGEVVAIGYE